MTLTELITKLRELDSKATPGPWDVDLISEVGSQHGDVTFCTSQYGRYREDAALIAESRNTLPALLKVIEIYREALEFYKNAYTYMVSVDAKAADIFDPSSRARKALSDAEELVK